MDAGVGVPAAPAHRAARSGHSSRSATGGHPPAQATSAKRSRPAERPPAAHRQRPASPQQSTQRQRPPLRDGTATRGKPPGPAPMAFPINSLRPSSPRTFRFADE
jgi:hypothetical protein